MVSPPIVNLSQIRYYEYNTVDFSVFFRLRLSHVEAYSAMQDFIKLLGVHPLQIQLAPTTDVALPRELKNYRPGQLRWPACGRIFRQIDKIETGAAIRIMYRDPQTPGNPQRSYRKITNTKGREEGEPTPRRGEIFIPGPYFPLT